MSANVEQLLLEDAGNKRVYFDQLGSSEPVRKLPALSSLPGDLYPHNFDTQPVDEMNDSAMMIGDVSVPFVRKPSFYKKKQRVSYLDFLAPAKKSYKPKKRYVSKSRKYQKPVRRARRLSKPAVRASASCSCSHGRKSYSRRAVKSTRRKRY